MIFTALKKEGYEVQEQTYREKIDNFFKQDFKLVDDLTTQLIDIQICGSYLESTQILNKIMKSGESIQKENSQKKYYFWQTKKNNAAKDVVDDIERNKDNISLLQQETQKRIQHMDVLCEQLQSANTALASRLSKKEAVRREIVFSNPKAMHDEINQVFNETLESINLNLIIQDQLINNIKLISSSYKLVMESITILYEILLPSIEILVILQIQKNVERVESQPNPFEKSQTSKNSTERVLKSFSMMSNSIQELNQNLSEIKRIHA